MQFSWLGADDDDDDDMSWAWTMTSRLEGVDAEVARASLMSSFSSDGNTFSSCRHGGVIRGSFSVLTQRTRLSPLASHSPDATTMMTYG